MDKEAARRGFDKLGGLGDTRTFRTGWLGKKQGSLAGVPCRPTRITKSQRADNHLGTKHQARGT